MRVFLILNLIFIRVDLKTASILNEPDCSIKEAVNKGEINASIYEDYKNIMEERGKKL